MKKFKFLLLLLVVLLSVSALSGCKNRNDSREAELEEKIEQLENKIAKMEENATASTGDSSSDAGSKEQSTTVMTTAPNVTSDTTLDTTSDTVESLSKEVNKITTKIDSATPSQNEDEKRTDFFALKDELELVEERIDAYDDYIESQQKRGNLSYEDYKSQERLLDELEDKLDASEDKLERTFGIYD